MPVTGSPRDLLSGVLCPLPKHLCCSDQSSVPCGPCLTVGFRWSSPTQLGITESQAELLLASFVLGNKICRAECICLLQFWQAPVALCIPAVKPCGTYLWCLREAFNKCPYLWLTGLSSRRCGGLSCGHLGGNLPPVSGYGIWGMCSFAFPFIIHWFMDSLTFSTYPPGKIQFQWAQKWTAWEAKKGPNVEAICKCSFWIKLSSF